MLTFHDYLSTLSFVQLVLAAVLPNLDVVAFVYGCNQGRAAPEMICSLVQTKERKKVNQSGFFQRIYISFSRAQFFFLPFDIFR